MFPWSFCHRKRFRKYKQSHKNDANSSRPSRKTHQQYKSQIKRTKSARLLQKIDVQDFSPKSVNSDFGFRILGLIAKVWILHKIFSCHANSGWWILGFLDTRKQHIKFQTGNFPFPNHYLGFLVKGRFVSFVLKVYLKVQKYTQVFPHLELLLSSTVDKICFSSF